MCKRKSKYALQFCFVAFTCFLFFLGLLLFEQNIFLFAETLLIGSSAIVFAVGLVSFFAAAVLRSSTGSSSLCRSKSCLAIDCLFYKGVYF